MSIYDRDYMRDEAPSFGDRLRQVSAFHWFFWVNIAVFAVQWWILPDLCLDHDVLRDIYMPAGSVSVESLTQGHVWTPFTYMFVHGSIGHILLNLIMLWFAGKRVQDLYGPRHFVLIYVLSGLIGATLQIVLSAYIMHQPEAALIGASASVMGLVLAYAVAMPEEEITMLLAFVIPVRVRLWGMAKFLLIINAAFGLLDMVHQLPAWLSGGANVAYFAHVGGALVGWYYARSLGYGGLPSELLQSRIRNKSRRPVMAGNPSVRRPVVEVDMEAVRRMNPRNDPVVDLMRDEVDPILDKISDFGMHSLTDEERRVLERASRKISRTRP